MFERLREIDEELSQLPEQLKPLEEQVERARGILRKAEESNPVRQTLANLLLQADRTHVENLGWIAGQQSVDPVVVANQTAKLLFSVGKSMPKEESSALSVPGSSGSGSSGSGSSGSGSSGSGSSGPGSSGLGDATSSYEAALANFVRVDEGMLTSNVESLLMRRLFAESWLSTESKVRARVMDQLKREVRENSRWLPEPRAQILDEEGKSVVGEGAGAFGSYFAASAVVFMALRQYQLQLPSSAFSLLNKTMSLLLDDSIHKKLSVRVADAAKTVERGRALLAIAYVHLIRSMQSGSYEREHNKIADVLSSAEVALETGKKRIARLRNARSEAVMQFAGVIGILVTALVITGYAIYTILAKEPPT
jgi:hypothetical protein